MPIHKNNINLATNTVNIVGLTSNILMLLKGFLLILISKLPRERKIVSQRF